MTEASRPQNDEQLEDWKEVCRELQHSIREIRNLTNKVLSFYHGEERVSVGLIERDCRDYLAASNQCYAVMRRTIDASKANLHYSLKQVMDYERKAADMIGAAHKAWAEMLAWVPEHPAAKA